MKVDYYPHGPQTDVPLATITGNGWRMCFSSKYNLKLSSSVANTIENSKCTKGKIMLGCRSISNPNTIQTLAWAPRDCVFNSTGADHRSTRTCEGTDWYFNYDGNIARSWGFVKEGDDVFKGNCDGRNTGCNDCRLCWHMTATHGGWRCGSTIGLDESTSYERVIFQIGKKPLFIFFV